MYKKLLLLLILFLFSGILYSQTAKEIAKDAPLALQNGEFVLYFQPICKFDKKKICGAEVLTRWQNGDKLIPPGKFIPVFEENGFIKEMDKYVFENTLKHINTWQEKGLQIGFISLNLSALDLEDTELISYFKFLLKQYKTDHKKLIIEITETGEIKDKNKAKEFIFGLKNLGLKVALDDFGDGNADLENLKTYPYDIIKLSKKMLKTFPENKKHLKDTIKELKQFNLPFIAEGIENKAEAKFLKKQGINLAQGYLFYKPMPAKDFENLLSGKLPKYCL